jgi:SAM-dependent methyltransferase
MKPDYGIDAPGVVRNFFVIGIVLLAIGWFLPVVHLGDVGIRLRPTALITGAFLVTEGCLMVLYAKWGKFRHRDRMLAMVDWKGDEHVLDVGTGRGLLMIGAAHKLSSGKAVGIDIWSGKDLSGNSMQNTLRNAELEGVRDRVEVKSEDATAMQFPDGTFDVVLSNLCLHNIPSAEARERACREILRVLKPGGRALISDFKNTGAYGKAFRAQNAGVKLGPLCLFDTFPPLRIVQVDKK